ncbi:T76 [Tupaiid betaherpesvirus 1]|uniref:T76 n=1 Tax=Tupaiid herpesvirus 1 (strain 1) TaxID=10397 RepID=Q91TM0_TUHV1|nr:T76 [Tupaiid betaherpesvirus 1]AAK57121.1 T76 [Tupaiid betaherpesvirus 1]
MGTVVGPGDPWRDLTCLPESRKRIGKQKHWSIYRKIAACTTFDALNALLGGLFPAALRDHARRVYFEVDFGCRVPDCVIVFSAPPRGRARGAAGPSAGSSSAAAVCYVLEFKTTAGAADAQTVQRHRLHRLQYLQGLRQLRDAIARFRGFFRAELGQWWRIVPAIVFFRQRPLRLTLCKAFAAYRQRVCAYSATAFLAERQDEAVKHLLPRAGVRRARGQPAAGQRRTAQAAARPRLPRAPAVSAPAPPGPADAPVRRRGAARPGSRRRRGAAGAARARPRRRAESGRR